MPHRIISSRKTVRQGMPDTWKKLIIVFMATWLPLQGYGAVAMPFCERAAGTENPMEANEVHAGHGASLQDGSSHDHGAGHADSHASGSADQPNSLDCSNCSPCHLACAPAIVVAPPLVLEMGRSRFAPPLEASMTSVSAERLKRPPRPALS